MHLWLGLENFKTVYHAPMQFSCIVQAGARFWRFIPCGQNSCQSGVLAYCCYTLEGLLSNLEESLENLVHGMASWGSFFILWIWLPIWEPCDLLLHRWVSFSLWHCVRPRLWYVNLKISPALFHSWKWGWSLKHTINHSVFYIFLWRLQKCQVSVFLAVTRTYTFPLLWMPNLQQCNLHNGQFKTQEWRVQTPSHIHFMLNFAMHRSAYFKMPH